MTTDLRATVGLATDSQPDATLAVVRGPLCPADVVAAAVTLADKHGLPIELPVAAEPIGALRIGDRGAAVEFRWRPAPRPATGTLGVPVPTPTWIEVVLTLAGEPAAAIDGVLADAGMLLRQRADAFTDVELRTITEAMPLVERFSDPCAALARWAVIFRDHYVENSVGFLWGLQRAGVQPACIFALAKGDQTRNRTRVDATFRRLGYHSDVLDNALIDGTIGRAGERAAHEVLRRVDAFVQDAHAHGLRVMVIDDGGLLAQGYGGGRPGPHIDGAIELTVSGLKRIAAREDLRIPVLNLARSRLKTRLAYREIADSCVRRLRTILPGEKFPGRRVLLAGFGTLGRRIARLLRDLGCRVTVIDTDVLALIEAAEDGFETRRTIREGLSDPPFLIVGTSGECALRAEDLGFLPNGVYLAGYATKDFSVLTNPTPVVARTLATTTVQGVGVRYEFPDARTALLLGDGRSLNLFDGDDIPNQGYDAYRAGTLLAAKLLAKNHRHIPAGVHIDMVDEMIARSGLFEACYELHVTGQPSVS
jgi:adenosylhomocysteinase